MGEFRGGLGDAMTVALTAEDLPPETVELRALLQFASDVAGAPDVTMGADAGAGTSLTVTPDATAEHAWRLVWRAEEGGSIGNGKVAEITVEAPRRIVPRQPVNLKGIEAELADGRIAAVGTDPSSLAVALIQDPLTLLAFLSGIIAVVFLLSQVKALEKFFTYLPPLIWMYFVPMVMTTIGVTPDSSSLYSPFMSRVVLPAILVLLLIPSDIKSLAKLGPKAVAMMLFATTGIVVGAISSFALWSALTPDHIPEGTWKGVAALAGSWIGGSTNMFAVLESVGTPPNIIGPLVIVDTVLAYSWLGLLIALVPYQRRIDKLHEADTSTVDAVSEHLLQEHEANARCPRTADIGFMLAVALVVSQLCLLLAGPVFHFFDETLGLKSLSGVVSEYAWAILLITAAGLLLSLTKVRSLDFCGASSVGNIGLYLLLTSYGARANLMAIFDVPVFFGIGFVWLMVHIAFLYAGVRILKAPLFLGATSSMANIGGTASAPVVAAAFNQSMAPVGLLMAILGGVLGTPLALFVVGMTCRAISGG
ncbi:MAG: hypothetical protein PWP23_1860 [Candidatus Sumerlaeota bacterium]|nr:hypothetical protein [Candidatus Sumerlaeota bacterium]